MKPQTLLVGALVIMVVMGAFLLGGGEGPESFAFGSDHQGDEQIDNPNPAAGDSPGPDGKRTAIEGSQTPPPPPLIDPEKTTEEVLPPVEGGWLVTAKEKKSGKPVVGARIYFADQALATDPTGFLRSLKAHAAAIEEMLRREGRIYQTDAKGETRVPMPASNNVFLAGRKGKLWACNRLKTSETPPLLLELEEEKTLRVRVINKKGDPLADVPVSLQRFNSKNKSYPLVQAVTDQTGLARFMDLNRHFRNSRFKSSQIKMEAALAIPLAEPISKGFDWKKLPQKPITLTMPRTGKVEVTILALDGKAPTCPTSISLTAYTPTGQSRSRAQPAPGGKRLYPYVGLGLRLRAKALLGEPNPTGSAATDGPGPTTPGETVRLTVSAQKEISQLAIMVVDPKGNPVVTTNLKWQYTMNHDHGSYSWHRGITKSDERGRITIPAYSSSGNTRLVLQVSTINQDPMKTSSGRLNMQSIYPPGITDLGKLHLLESRPILAGIVVDGKGKPVSGAKLTISEKHIFDKSRNFFWWNRIYGVEATSGPKGKFAFVGAIEGPDLQVRATKKGASSPRPVEAVIGTRDLRIVMVETNQLMGMVLLDQEIGGRLIRAQLQCEKDEGGTERYSTSIKSNDGKFTFNSVPPGVATLKIMLSQDGSELTTIEGIRVIKGKEIDDPRLKEIDLRGQLHKINISFLGSDGAEVRHVNVKKGPRFRRSQYLYQRKSFIIATHPVVDIEVSASDYMTKTYYSVRDGDCIRLTPTLKAMITVKGGHPELPGGIYLQAYLRPTKGSGGINRTMLPRGTTFSCRRAGEYRVRISLGKKIGRYSGASIQVSCKPTTIKVEEREEVQTFQISLSKKSLEAAHKILEEQGR